MCRIWFSFSSALFMVFNFLRSLHIAVKEGGFSSVLVSVSVRRAVSMKAQQNLVCCSLMPLTFPKSQSIFSSTQEEDHWQSTLEPWMSRCCQSSVLHKGHLNCRLRRARLGSSPQMLLELITVVYHSGSKVLMLLSPRFLAFGWWVIDLRNPIGKF